MTCPTPRATTGTRREGGWPFSNRAHGWPITDCTAEGFKCALALEGRYAPGIPEGLLRDAVRLMLSWQNDDGGWATYERKRGPALARAPEPVAGLRRHHGRLLLCRVHERDACRPSSLAKQRFPDLAPRDRSRDRARRAAPARATAPGRQLRGIVGRLLHVRDVVRRHRPPRGRRTPRRRGHRAGVPLSPRRQRDRRRLGRARRLVPRAPLHPGQRRRRGPDLLGARDPRSRAAPRQRPRSARPCAF